MTAISIKKSLVLAFTACSSLTLNAYADVIVNYSDFSDTSGLTTVGNTSTAVTSDGTVLRLTPAAGNQRGAAYSTVPVTLGANATFSTQFQFRFTQPGGWDPADGIVFILSNNTSGLGSTGVGMGYSGVHNSVGIEFDTYNNAGYGLGNNDGNSSNHVSIDTNGVLENLALTNVYNNGSCGFPSGGHPNQNNYLSDGCMSNGHIWTAAISYNGTSLSVSVKDSAIGAQFYAINDLSINISQILGTNQAYIGFTSATGAGRENHDILNWQFANTTELAPGNTNPNSVPEPSTIALTGIALLYLKRTQKSKK